MCYIASVPKYKMFGRPFSLKSDSYAHCGNNVFAPVKRELIFYIVRNMSYFPHYLSVCRVIFVHDSDFTFSIFSGYTLL